MRWGMQNTSTSDEDGYKGHGSPPESSRIFYFPLKINWTMVLFSTLVVLIISFLLVHADLPGIGRRSKFPQEAVILGSGSNVFSQNVSTCPGYKLQSVQETNTGLKAQLQLAGQACNAFGHDVDALTVEVTYETSSRLHVNIYDTSNQQFTIPSSVVQLPPPPTDSSLKQKSDLVFNYDPSPFAFWITRRSDGLSAIPLFDTRISSLPAPSIVPVMQNDTSTVLQGFPLVFEDQYLQITSALPLDTNIYGLGEVIASSGFRRNIGGTLQTMWNRDVADPVDENVYGSHPIYLEHRFNPATGKSQSHGVLLFSAAGSDILLATPPNSNASLIQYRMIGGVLDFYFFSGPDPKNVIEQYGELIGYPTWQPSWGFGFHLCRWGYTNVSVTRDQVTRMREANIPLEVMWNDIDLYHAYRDFTTDPESFPPSELQQFIAELTSNHQRYIPIVDAAIAVQVNSSDVYDPYTSGIERNTFIQNPDRSEYIGRVWPGYTVFPDWFQPNTQAWWTEALQNWSNLGVGYSGIWLDMNEASSFCDGSCGTGADLSDTGTPFMLPGAPGNPVLGYPECYDETFGPSGNITVNETYTCQPQVSSLAPRSFLGAGQQQAVNLTAPPYAIHNGYGPIGAKTIATNATHYQGIVEYDVHNLWGLMEEKTTHLALQTVQPGKRPFLISRSTYASSGKWTGHWLGDNFSLWSYMKYNIAGVLQFQIFQNPFVGADTCGFNQNTDEELCNRWMQLSAFVPFYRNHNIMGALSQEPYRWESVANASRTAMAIRYSLLPYWYTLFANASRFGTPPVRALFFEFPDEPELFGVDTQFLVGGDILVTPVLTPNATTVEAKLPGVMVHTEVVTPSDNGSVVRPAPLGHINVHIRDGAAILLYAKPAYTIYETQQGPFALVVTQASDGSSFGTAYLDDGESYPPGPSRELTITASVGEVSIKGEGTFQIEQNLEEATILGVSTPPESVSLNGKAVGGWEYFEQQKRLVVSGLATDLNSPVLLQWK
ncbi:glycoside hydrolase family 31 protein [Amanita muscaria Koide BX008]|uniref:Glycoside hydrolase family 31 protein n=1 Tax=Amanita muscaria (strain Koide BX008) TaxID=946122 RepID=A0A0C2WU11_AMAMK|nr:glycoside hydrolase family 31 protein [Amanita muscaria Koide BX008]